MWFATSKQNNCKVLLKPIGIPRTVNPRASTTQAASLHRLGVALGLIKSNRSNRVKTGAAYMMKAMQF